MLILHLTSLMKDGVLAVRRVQWSNVKVSQVVRTCGDVMTFMWISMWVLWCQPHCEHQDYICQDSTNTPCSPYRAVFWNRKLNHHHQSTSNINPAATTKSKHRVVQLYTGDLYRWYFDTYYYVHHACIVSASLFDNTFFFWMITTILTKNICMDNAKYLISRFWSHLFSIAIFNPSNNIRHGIFKTSLVRLFRPHLLLMKK